MLLNTTSQREHNPTATSVQQELSYMANLLNVPVQEVRRAMDAVGTSREKIQAFLKEHGNRG